MPLDSTQKPLGAGFRAMRCRSHLSFRYRHVANRYQARALNKGILDGFLLQTFIELPTNKQRDLVAPIGTNRETIINDLADLAFTW
jgi:hypothetical protein